MSLCEIIKNNVLERYDALINNAPVGILLVDLDGNIVELNPRVIEILGSPSIEETRKINVLAFPPLVEAGISEAAKKSLSGEPVVVEEIPYKSVWGKEIVVRFTAVPVYDEKNFVCFSLVIMEDMTSYTQLKLQLERTNKMLKTVIDSIPSMIWLKDREGRYLFTNKAFDEFNSFLSTDPMGKTDYDLWPPDQADRFTHEDLSVRECEYPLEKIDDILHPTLGTKHYRTIKVGVCDADKELVGTVGISCDVTKQYEQDQVLAEAIETLTASLNGNVYVK